MSPLFGIHIPKTAGTSLRIALDQSIPKQVRYIYRSPPGMHYQRFIEVNKNNLDEQTVVYGHYSYGIHEPLGYQPRYFTVLRNPIHQALSLYRHEYRVKQSVYNEQMTSYTIAGFFQDPPAMIFNNPITRLLAGQLNQRETGQWYLEFEADLDELLEKAVQHLLSSFVFVGFTETIRKDIHRLEKITGTKITINAHNVDPSPIPIDTLSEEDYSAILQSTVFDRKLIQQFKSTL